MARKRVKWQRSPIYGYGRTEAEAEADLRAKLTPSIGPKRNPVTLHELATDVWYPHVLTLAPLTRKRYEGVYVNHIRAELGGCALEDLGAMAVRHWLSGLKESEHTKHYALNVLKAILSEAVKLELMNRNPCSSVTIPRNYAKRERVLDLDQALALLEDSRGTSLSAPIFLACTLSLRRGEIAGLKWSDMDRTKGEMRIVRQRQAIRPLGVVERELKTSESRRTLYLPSALIEEIDKRGDLDSEYICTNWGSPWVPDTITQHWGKLRGEFGLEGWHFHDLRHLAAGLLAAAGCDLLVIAAVLGHKKPDMTLLYTSVSESRRREGADRLGRLLGSRPST
jgi:integrase